MEENSHDLHNPGFIGRNFIFESVYRGISLNKCKDGNEMVLNKPLSLKLSCLLFILFYSCDTLNLQLGLSLGCISVGLIAKV